MTLRSVYENPRTSTRDAKLLAKRAGTTVKSARAFLRTVGSAKVSAGWRRPASAQLAPTGAPQDHWQADVIWFDDYRGVNDRRKAILTVLNTTTRYAIARPLLNAKAGTVAAAMADILDRDKPRIKVLRVDGGSEFKGLTRKLLTDRGITLQPGEPNTHYWITRTDRFHRTLRKRIGEHFERAQTHRWVDVLPDLIRNYNETPHRTLSETLGRRMAPASMTKADERRIRSAESAQVASVRARTDALAWEPGRTRVRLLAARTREGVRGALGRKGHNVVWTREAYTILARNGPNSWRVDVPRGEVRVWPSYALKPVDERETPRRKKGPRVNVRVERAKRMEARNISEAEQKAALAAPARPRRQRAARVDYEKLSLAAPARPRRQRAARVDYEKLSRGHLTASVH